jgi:HD-GYP domain-containing protein (c-di-GMP phosphodiesterase class II)
MVADMDTSLGAPAAPAVSQGHSVDRVAMATRSVLERIRWLLFEQFERLLVLLLVASLLVIHWFVDYKVAFLSFYYLPIIVAGFLVGRNTAVWSAVLVISLVLFFQQVQGLDGPPGFDAAVTLALAPWAGFLILTGYVVGTLAQQRQAQLDNVKQSYLAMLELLTFSLEAAERGNRGHSHRVAEMAVRLAQGLGLREAEAENIRVAALLHEIGPESPRLLSLVSQFPGGIKGLPIADAMRGATQLLSEYARYFEVVGDDWPVDQLPMSEGAKILAVADAFETLQLTSPHRPALAPWSAVAEIERGAGRVFASEVVRVLKRITAAPLRASAQEERPDEFTFKRN